MGSFQPFLIALLGIVVAVTLTLLVRMVRERRERSREQAIIAGAEHRMQSRLAAIGDPSIPPEPEPPYERYVPVVRAPRPIPSAEEATTTRRRVWRDASGAMVVFACFGLVVVLALPAVGQSAHAPSAPPTDVPAAEAVPTTAPTEAAIALVPAVLPTRLPIVLPTDAPTPSLPITATPAPTQRVAAARATPQPTARPRATPKPTPKPKPKPTPIPDPIARFTCSFVSDLRVAFDSTSRYAKSYLWDFDGDGTSTAANPTHTFSGSGAYRVSLTVSNASGSDTATKFIDLDARTGCS